MHVTEARGERHVDERGRRARPGVGARASRRDQPGHRRRDERAHADQDGQDTQAEKKDQTCRQPDATPARLALSVRSHGALDCTGQVYYRDRLGCRLHKVGSGFRAIG